MRGATEMNNCPKCGATLKKTTNLGVTVEECDSCGYCYNTATGEEKFLNYQSKSCIVKCPSCASKLRIMGNETVPTIHIGDVVSCHFCNSTFQIPETPDADLRLTITCPNCSGKSRIPANKGKLSVTCPQCKSNFIHDTGTWPEKLPSAQQTHSSANTQTTANTNECYQCPKCGWTHPNTSALNESIAAHTQCQSCGHSYLVHLTWDE